MNSFLITALFLAAEPARPAVSDVRDMVASKSRMNDSYSLTYRVEGHRPGSKPPMQTKWSWTTHIWRAGNKLRIDQLDTRQEPPRAGHNPADRHLTCINCEREGYGIVTDVFPKPQTLGRQISFRDLKTNNVDYQLDDIDWRYFGLCNACKNLYQRIHVVPEMTRLLENSDLRVATEDRQGVPCIVISRKRDRDDRHSWYSARVGYNPIYYEFKVDVGKGPEVHSTEIDWRATAGGHWFPRTVKHVETVNGRLNYEEVLTFTHADFHNPVDPAVFTFAGFHLNDLHPIAFPGLAPNDYPHWRNGKVDYSYTVGMHLNASLASRDTASSTAVLPSTSGPLAASYPEGENWPVVAGFVAGVSSLVTLIAAVIFRRRKAAAS